MSYPVLKTSVPWYKQLLSYLHPIKMQTFTSVRHDYIELYLQNNQFQLVYNNAIYSYGNAYIPFLKAFEAIPDSVTSARQTLILGGGLGSIPQIIADKYQNKATTYTIVEIDSLIIDLCRQYLRFKQIANCQFINEDATQAITRLPQRFDLICLDIFNDIDVPKSVLSETFFKSIYQRLTPDGILVFNFIATVHNSIEDATQLLKSTFSNITIVSYKRNTLFICALHAI